MTWPCEQWEGRIDSWKGWAVTGSAASQDRSLRLALFAGPDIPGILQLLAWRLTKNVPSLQAGCLYTSSSHGRHHGPELGQGSPGGIAAAAGDFTHRLLPGSRRRSVV